MIEKLLYAKNTKIGEVLVEKDLDGRGSNGVSSIFPGGFRASDAIVMILLVNLDWM